jgi:hypothetical protein
MAYSISNSKEIVNIAKLNIPSFPRRRERRDIGVLRFCMID